MPKAVTKLPKRRADETPMQYVSRIAESVTKSRRDSAPFMVPYRDGSQGAFVCRFQEDGTLSCLFLAGDPAVTEDV